MPRNLKELLVKTLPSEKLKLLRDMGRGARAIGMSLHLVGGTVRDMLMGLPVKDLDLVVEGDAPKLADVIAKSLGAKSTTHSRFGTATVKIGDLRLDLATARREIYARPGALPEVNPSTIARDLARRDFTVNAMALHLSGERLGELVDPHNGLQDLEQRLIRVLHARSFIDDPTRILRAARYEQRLGFRMEENTARWLKQAVQQHALDTVSGDRVRRELELIFREVRPWLVLKRLGELDVLSAIHPSIKDAAIAEHIEQAAGRKEPLLYLAAVASMLSNEEGEALINRLNMPAKWAQVVRETISLGGRLKSPLPTQPAELRTLLDSFSPISIQAWMHLTSDQQQKESLSLFLTRLRYVNASITGQDLIALGVPEGPLVGKILAAIQRAKLEGRVTSKKEELELAHELHAKHGGV